MRGEESLERPLFSYISLEERVPKKHPLRVVRRMADEALADHLEPPAQRRIGAFFSSILDVPGTFSKAGILRHVADDRSNRTVPDLLFQ